MSKIVRLSSTNYKRLKAVEIQPDPDGSLVIVAGRNGQGKSSVLDSITAALGGVNSKTTPKPIRDGEDRAEIVLETEELVVTRRFTPSGSTLTVKSTDGATYSKGQGKLDDLLGKLSLDPLAFTQLSDRDQLAALLDLVELTEDIPALDAERNRLYSERTDIGRRGKAIGDVSVDDSLPTDEASASELIAKIRDAHEANRAIDDAEAQRVRLAQRVAELEAELKLAREKLGELETRAQGERIDASDLEAQLSSIEDTNAQIRENNAARERAALQAGLREEYGKLTAEIEAIDKRKADALSAAEFPVDGLGFDADGVTYQGVPFKQASSAEQLRVSLAMAIALNPQLRVIRIADGSLLDADNLALIEQMATEHDFQVWIEVVGDGNGAGVVIEDGEVTP